MNREKLGLFEFFRKVYIKITEDFPSAVQLIFILFYTAYFKFYFLITRDST